MYENGLIVRNRKFFIFASSVNCPPGIRLKTFTHFSALSIYEQLPPFFIMALGILISSILIAGEMFMNRRLSQIL